MDPPNGRFDVQPNASSHFSWINTQLSLQRTLMAAVRTAVSLIGFGFTVAQFFERMQGRIVPGGRPLDPTAPRDLGLLLISAGVLSLAAFTWQYHRANAYLRRGDFEPIRVENPVHSPVYLTSLAVMLIGVAAFVSVFLRF
jgi:putative membrane protein